VCEIFHDSKQEFKGFGYFNINLIFERLCRYPVQKQGQILPISRGIPCVENFTRVHSFHNKNRLWPAVLYNCPPTMKRERCIQRRWENYTQPQKDEENRKQYSTTATVHR